MCKLLLFTKTNINTFESTISLRNLNPVRKIWRCETLLQVTGGLLDGSKAGQSRTIKGHLF